MEFARVVFSQPKPDVKDLLIALLSHERFEGFEENDSDLVAYVPAAEFDEQKVKLIASRYHVEITIAQVPSQNWNQVWESNFKPVVVDDFCAIRAEFHPPEASTLHEIIITPKMSFGTGHHATTYMMISAMRNIDFRGKKVLDFGTGTGVLAILASKLGASEVLAIDIDEWSISNSKENIIKNNTRVETMLASSAEVNRTFDIILANITRNVIIANFAHFVNQTSEGLVILLSGLLESDEEQIREAAREHHLSIAMRWQRDQWVCIKLVRS